jgi:hypothetical protein
MKKTNTSGKMDQDFMGSGNFKKILEKKRIKFFSILNN